MNTKALPVPTAYGPATPCSTDKTRAEAQPQGHDLLAELMFELAVRDMSRRSDVHHARLRAD